MGTRNFILRIFCSIIAIIAINSAALANSNACSANYTATIDPVNKLVNFYNLSEGDYTNSDWNFGDSAYSQLQNPVHQYSDTGFYTICLEISGNDCISSVCYDIYIGESIDECVAEFSFENTNQLLEYSFTNHSLGSIDSIHWDFGDGFFSNDDNPIHLYNNLGTYQASLSVFNSLTFCMDTFYHQIEITDPCTADFTYESIGDGFEYAFQNQSLGDIDSIIWDFGDGTFSYDENPNHIYSDYGNYLVNLHIINESTFCDDTYEVTIGITNDCKADFIFEIASGLNKPSAYKFTDQSIGIGNNWHWDFGDGSTIDAQNPIHYFPKNDTFQVTLSIDNGACNDQITKTVIVFVPLDVSFNFQLDSNNVIPNTFIFSTQLTGYYDQHYWDFGDGITADVADTIHSYPKQDTDYQVCLTATYGFNDTSILSKISCKGLTTSEYYNIGGQVYFGDTLMNNPTSTGDTALAYLYRVDENHLSPIDTNYYTSLGYYWFAQKLKAYYVIKTGLIENSTHYANYAPTYVGNTTQWDEAEIINLAQDRYRDDIHLVEKETKKSGSTSLDGFVYDILDIDSNYEKAVICIFDMEENLIDYQYTDDKGVYNFENLSKGHYMLSADVTGIPVRPQLIFIDGKRDEDLKSASLKNTADIFPNPAIDYSILSYSNQGDTKEVKIQLVSTQGSVLYERNFQALSGTNYFRLDLSDVSKGLFIVRIVDESIRIEKLLHY